MKTILVIGIGMGSPEHLTVGAIAALNRADVLFIPDKGASKADLADIRRGLIERFVEGAPVQVSYAVPRREARGDYEQDVDDWHGQLAEVFATLIDQVPDEGIGAFLVWGDPGLYDSTLRILDRVDAQMRIEVVPGITAVQALTAAHGIALNRIGSPVLITTGRQLGTIEMDTVVMLDGEQAFMRAPQDLEIFWGAYLGTGDEILISGILGAVRDEIAATRAAARARHGWIMDTYLLRRRD